MTTDIEVVKRFAEDVENHTVKVLHEDGIYRHLMCRSKDSFMYWFEIITSPGQLTIRGDMGTFVFARLTDMFEFFGSGTRINAQYWGEKLQASSEPIKRYSKQVAIQHAKEALADQLEYKDPSREQTGEIKSAFNQQVLAVVNYEESDERAFRQAIDEFEVHGVRFEDSWEWDLTEYDGRYLWNLHAILWAIREYRKLNVAQAVASQLSTSV